MLARHQELPLHPEVPVPRAEGKAMNAILLAGGQGTHLVPLVRTAPKALLPVANRPRVEYLLPHLKKNGIREVPLTVD